MSVSRPNRPKFKVKVTIRAATVPKPAPRIAEFLRYAETTEHAVAKVTRELAKNGYEVIFATASEEKHNA